jgi:hypothetical protein
MERWRGPGTAETVSEPSVSYCGRFVGRRCAVASDRISRGLNLCVPEDREAVLFAIERLPKLAARAREMWLLSGHPGGDPIDQAKDTLRTLRDLSAAALRHVEKGSRT